MNGFHDWVNFHCQHTGGNAYVRDVLVANENVLTINLRATMGELRDATTIIVVEGRIPDWPHEQVNAIVQEIRRQRAEKLGKPLVRTGCEYCSGSLLVEVVHPACMVNGEVAYAEDSNHVYTGTVRCDRCEKGLQRCREQDARSPIKVGHKEIQRLLRLTEYESQTHCNALDLLTQWRATQASRRPQSEPDAELAELCDRVKKKVRELHSVM